jgi:hypothetical protein
MSSLISGHDRDLDGVTTVANELRAERLSLTGEPPLRESMQRWLGLSPMRHEPGNKVHIARQPIELRHHDQALPLVERVRRHDAASLRQRATENA